MQFVSERGPHWQTLWNLEPYQDNQGDWQFRTNTIVQVETGLNYVDADGNYAPASDAFKLVPGAAVAWDGQHKVSLGWNLNTTDAVQLRLPDGGLLTGHVYGLAYYDPESGETALIAEVQDSQGLLVSPNQLLYPAAFTDLEADVRYTYTKAGFEQDVILRQALPPLPEGFGPESRLEVWTEFTEAPQLEKQSSVLRPAISGKSAATALVDETLDFGAMRMGTGKSFLLGQEDDSLSPVAKQWLTTQEGRTFLVEAVTFSQVESEIEELPPAKKGGASVSHRYSDRWQALLAAPKRNKGQSTAGRVKRLREDEQAMVSFARPGLVLDWATYNTSQTNFTFKGDTTYWITGPVGLFGTNTTVEGGVVIKFTHNVSNLKLTVNTPLTWGGSLYRPVVLTAQDDHSVGKKIGTNSLSGYYATTALCLDATTNTVTNFNLSHLRIAYAQTAIELKQKSGHVLGHVQLVNCQNGIAPTSADFSLRNALFHNVVTNFIGSSSTGRVEHLTVDTAGWFNYTNTFSLLYVTNSLLTGVTNVGALSNTNQVAIVSNPAGIFQTALAGAHYLASASPYRNLGTTGINVTLAKELTALTTFPPLALTASLTNSQTLNPQATRDTDLPDLGYHYPSLDYYLSGVTLANATVTLTNGVALGFYGATGLALQNAATLISEGTPVRPNRLVRYQAVQEQPTVYTTSESALLGVASLQSTRPVLRFRFTDFPTLGASTGSRTLFNVNAYYVGEASFTDCQLRGTYVRLGENSGGSGYSTLFAMTNSVAERAYVYLSKYYYGVDVVLTVNVWNTLFWNGTVGLYNDYSSVSYNPTWTVKDSHFDTVSLRARLKNHK